MKNRTQKINEELAELCRNGRSMIDPYMTDSAVCAQCSVRPGRPGCVLFGTSCGYYDAPEPSGADAGNNPRGRGMRLRIVHVRKGSAGSVRGFASPAVIAWHNMLHEVIAELVKDGMSYDEANLKAGMAVGPMPKVKPSDATEEDFLNHFADEIYAHEAAQAQEGAPANMGGRGTISPADLEEVQAAAKHWSSMTPEYRDAKVAECLAACSPAAMPEDMAARIAKRMSREQRRVLRRIGLRSFVCGMADGLMICFRVMWIAAVVAFAIAAGIALMVLFLTGVLWLIY